MELKYWYKDGAELGADCPFGGHFTKGSKVYNNSVKIYSANCCECDHYESNDSDNQTVNCNRIPQLKMKPCKNTVAGV